MADLNKGYSDVKQTISGFKTFKQSKSDITSITSKQGNSDAPANSDIANPLNKLEEQKNKAQKAVQDQISQLLGILTQNSGRGLKTTKVLLKTMTKTVKKIRPEVEELVITEIIKLLGCSQQQSYEGNQDFYIKVRTSDFKNLFEIDPESNVGKTKYEKNKDLDSLGPKYPLNRQLYKRIQEEGIPYTFKGASEQELFDISYVQQDQNGTPGDFFKVSLKNRETAPNKVFEFLRDYYKRVSLFDFSIVVGEIMNNLTGAISIEAGAGVNTTKDNSKFGKILARILGMCFDNRSEIDVSGVAKVGELDNLDEDFFEFTDLDLMSIDQEVTNIQNSAVEIEGCENIKFPVNSFEIVQSIDDLNFIDENDDDALLRGMDNSINTFINNQSGVGIGLDLDLNVSLKFNFDFVSKFPNSFISSIFTPKVFLGFLIMLKALGKFTPANDITSMTDFTKKYKSLFIGIASKIAGLFVRELFNVLKKDIFIFIKSLSKDISSELTEKKVTIYTYLAAFLIQIINIVRDWRQCKSVLDQILALLKLPRIPGLNQIVPPPLLYLTPLLPGYSAERSFLNHILELQKLGIPTGPLPDGSPNLGLIATYGLLKGQSKELFENGKTEFVIPSLPVLPSLTTGPIPWSGKFV
jgi:hypothetical protein